MIWGDSGETARSIVYRSLRSAIQIHWPNRSPQNPLVRTLNLLGQRLIPSLVFSQESVCAVAYYKTRLPSR